MNGPGQNAAALIIAALVASPSPAPSPVATPLREIGRVRSTILCSTLSQSIAPTLAGLIKNDEVITAGHNAFRKMSYDQTAHSPDALVLDRNYLGQVVRALVHNLHAVDLLLADQKRFPANPKTEDERAAVAMKDQLQAIAHAQNDALNLISGTIETEALGQMQYQGLHGPMQTATTPDLASSGPPAVPGDDPTSFIDRAGLPDLPGTVATPSSNTLGNNQFDHLSQTYESLQNNIAKVEQPASIIIMPVVTQCRASAAPPASPSASPSARP